MLPNSVSQSILDYFSRQYGKNASILSVVTVSGGCINETAKVQTSHGDFFVKYNLSSVYPGMFEAESKGLKILQQAEEILIPEVLHAEVAGKHSYLLMEYIEPGVKSPGFWEQFGSSLANLHKHTSDLFGLDHDNYIGSLQQGNQHHSSWVDFFVLERLEPMARHARDKDEISAQLVNSFEQLYNKLPRLMPEEKPALLHGDLWNGNYLVDENGNPCLIDPAVYYGHREIDLAMTSLFGGFHPKFYESYQQVFALEKGWEERTDLFNLYPLLVHANLFGGGYASQVKKIINKYV
ncbi:MAG: fructosamine kinase family protein [Bacteroidetes bacterium]|nr:fructosamine kinase family protein [Bacteroidota bacterium]